MASDSVTPFPCSDELISGPNEIVDEDDWPSAIEQEVLQGVFVGDDLRLLKTQVPPTVSREEITTVRGTGCLSSNSRNQDVVKKVLPSRTLLNKRPTIDPNVRTQLVYRGQEDMLDHLFGKKAQTVEQTNGMVHFVFLEIRQPGFEATVDIRRPELEIDRASALIEDKFAIPKTVTHVSSFRI